MPIPNNILRFTLNYNGRGPSGVRSNVVSVGYVPGPGAPAQGSPEMFGEALNWLGGAFWPKWSSLLSTSTSLESVSIAVSTASTFVPIAANLTGARNGTKAPPQMAQIAQLRTATGGRRGRGRWFLPDALETDYGEDGILNPSVASQMEGDLLEVQQVCEGDGAILPFEQSLTGLYLLHADGGTPSRVLFISMNPQPGWIRRRGR